MPEMPIPDDWDGQSFCCHIVQWPASPQWQAILLGQITEPMRGRFWDGTTGTITDVQAIGQQIYQLNVIDGGCVLGCIEDLSNVLQQIAISSAGGGCGCGTAPGLIDIGGTPYYGTEQPLSEPTSFGQPGDEFATEAAYDAHKCKVANAIVDGFVQALNAWSTLTLTQIIVGGIAIVGLIAIGLFTAPPLALLLALGATGFAFGALHTIANAIDDNREDIICFLWNSETAQEAYDTFYDFLRGLAIDVGVVEVELGPLVTLLENLAPIDTMNKLFTGIGLPATYDEFTDCSTCDTCPDIVPVFGDYDGPQGGDNHQFSALSPNFGSDYLVQFRLNNDGSGYCGSMRDMRVISLPNFDPVDGTPGKAHQYSDQTGAFVYNSNTLSFATFCAAQATFVSNNPITLTIEIGADCV